jgi:hypothetical protein
VEALVNAHQVSTSDVQRGKMQADVGGGKGRLPETGPIERVDPDAGGHQPQASPEPATIPQSRGIPSRIQMSDAIH